MGRKIATLSAGIAFLLLLFSPRATADTFQYDFTIPAFDIFPEVDIVFTVTSANLPASGHVTSFTSTSDPLIFAFDWNSAASGNCFGNLSIAGFACAGYAAGTSAGIDAFLPGSFLSPGTYTSIGGGETVVITDLSAARGVPEPSSVFLLACGIFTLLATVSLYGRHRVSPC